MSDVLETWIRQYAALLGSFTLAELDRAVATATSPATATRVNAKRSLTPIRPESLHTTVRSMLDRGRLVETAGRLTIKPRTETP